MKSLLRYISNAIFLLTIVHANLSLDGSISFYKVSSGNKLNFWPQATRVYGNTIYFSGTEDGWLKKMTIGTIEK